MNTRIPAGLMLCFLLVTPLAAQETDDKRQQIVALLERSGLAQLIEQVPLHIQAGIDESLQEDSDTGIPPRDIATLSDIIQQAFASEVILRDTVDHFQQHYDAARLSSVMDKLGSPLAEKMMQLEVESATPSGVEKMLAFATALQDEPPPESRLQLLTELDRNSHATELTVAMQIEIFQSIMGVISAYAAQHGMPFVTEELMEQSTDMMAEQIWESAQAMTLVSYLYTYRSISDGDIRKYIDMYRDHDMQWYLALSSSALIHAMTRAMASAGDSITQQLKGTQRQS